MWCASYDPAGGDAVVRVWKVASYVGGVPQVGAVVVADTPVTLLATAGATFDREEVGYAWPDQHTTIPDAGGATENGLYCIEISEAGDWNGATSRAYFLVRRPTASTRVLVSYAFSTNVAYAGGAAGMHRNLYNSFQSGRTRRVSLDRPFTGHAFGTKDQVTIEFAFELEHFIRRLKGDATVDVCTSFDLHEDPNLLDHYDLFVSVGHDEYYSKEMGDHLRAFVAGGGNVAFFSANTAWWRVRFADPATSSGDVPLGNRTMVCFKSGIEDPLDGVDYASVTPGPCSVPVAGIAGGGSHQEENTLTGVSYRNGTQGYTPTPYTILEPRHDYLNGVPGPTFGADGLFTLETDAALWSFRDGLHLATGADGSPRNFRVIAAADMRQTEMGQRGQATMGVYTNGGVVFTAATTHWAQFIGTVQAPGSGNGDIKTITTNVINDLFSRRVPPESPWILPARTYPGDAWTVVEQLQSPYPYRAVGASVEGHLLVENEGVDVSRRDPENPAGALQGTSVPQLAGLTCYGADLYGTFLFAGASDKLYRRTGRLQHPPPVPPWPDPLGTPQPGASVVGVAGHDKLPYVVTRSGATSTLFRVMGVSGSPPLASFARVGRVYPPIRPITSFDGTLFGVRDPGANDTDPLDLYCREAMETGKEVDLVWTKIGTAPAGTYSLAAYYGRLYALAGTSTMNPTLYWRAAVASPGFPYRAPSVLLLSGASGIIGRVSSNGDFEQTGTVTLPFSYDIVTRVNEGMTFFYRNDGSADLVRFSSDGTFTAIHTWSPGSFGLSWSHIVHVFAGERSWTDLSPIAEKVLFYKQGGTWGYIGHFTTTPPYYVHEWASGAFNSGWTKIACTYKGELFFYNGAQGTWASGTVDNQGTFFGGSGGSGLPTQWDWVVPAGHTYLMFYRSSGNTNVAELHDGTFTTNMTLTFAAGWTPVTCANGVVMLYDAATGNRHVVGFRQTAMGDLRADAAALPTGYTHVASLGVLS